MGGYKCCRCYSELSIAQEGQWLFPQPRWPGPRVEGQRWRIKAEQASRKREEKRKRTRGVRNEKRKRKRRGSRRGREREEEGKEKRKGKCERKRKQKGKKQVRRLELPRAPTYPRAPACGAARAPDRAGPGCAICSPGLVRSGRLLSPACFPSAAAWTAARPARAPAAPRCVGCAGGQRVASARLRSGVCGPESAVRPRALPSRAASRCHLQPPLPPPGGRLGENRPWLTPTPQGKRGPLGT